MTRLQRHQNVSDVGPVLDESHIPTVICVNGSNVETPAPLATVEEPGQPSADIEAHGNLVRAMNKSLPHG